MRYVLTLPIKVAVIGKYLGVEDVVKGKVIAIEFYKNSVPTFTFQSDSGHLFAYLPPIAFSYENLILEDVVDINCSGSMPNISYLNIDKGFGKVNDKVIEFESYICSIDWDIENVLIHCVRLKNGTFAFIRNSRFQIGGKSWNPPNWKKLRKEWKLDLQT